MRSRNGVRDDTIFAFMAILRSKGVLLPTVRLTTRTYRVARAQHVNISSGIAYYPFSIPPNRSSLRRQGSHKGESLSHRKYTEQGPGQ